MKRKPVDRSVLLGIIQDRVRELEAESPHEDPEREAARQQLIAALRTAHGKGVLADLLAKEFQSPDRRLPG